MIWSGFKPAPNHVKVSLTWPKTVQSGFDQIIEQFVHIAATVDHDIFTRITYTLFSQLCDQFMIRRNYAESFDGFQTRILIKIMVTNTIQLINKLENRNINNLKISVD